ncbi:MAG: redoxin domain-containing protein, partial [Chloroflexi bacterium]|nr:redoxin domain-containing protein [Chloroflexota bacterium]
GQLAPNFDLRTVDGKQISLAELRQPVLLVFLRHLG